MTAQVTAASFDEEVMQSSVPVMLDFYADWCGPCQALLPIVEELEKEYAGKVKILKVNVDESPELSEKFGVMSIPTLVFLKEGKLLMTQVGALPKNALADKLNSVL